MNFSTPFYPGAPLSDATKLAMMQHEMWPVIFALHAEWGLYVCETTSRIGTSASAPRIGMCSEQGWMVASVSHTYRTVRRKSSTQIIINKLGSHLTGHTEEVFASVKPRYVITKLRDKKHQNAINWRGTIAQISQQPQRAVTQLVHDYTTARREEITQTNWSLTADAQLQLVEVLYNTRSPSDLSTSVRESVNTAWAKIEARKKFREGNREEVDALFNREKWMVAWDHRCNAYVVGSVDCSKAIPDVLTRMRTGSPTAKESSMYQTPETITTPFRKYWGIHNIPQDIQAALMPRMVMAKMAISQHDKFADPDKFLPMVDNFKMWPEAGVLAHCYAGRGNPVILIDK